MSETNWNDVGVVCGVIAAVGPAFVATPVVAIAGAVGGTVSAILSWADNAEKDDESKKKDDLIHVLRVHSALKRAGAERIQPVRAYAFDNSMSGWLGVEEQVHHFKGVGWKDLHSGYFYWNPDEGFKPHDAQSIWRHDASVNRGFPKSKRFAQ